MRPISAVEFPQRVEQVYRQSRRLEWITIGYLASSALLLYATMGSSQAMRTSFFEDAISIVPAAAFLVCTAIARRPATVTFPYGTHRATSIGHLIAALALSALGLLLLTEAAVKLLSSERPDIRTVLFFDHVIWAGWPMLAALLYSSVPTLYLGRLKLRLAPQFHDKIMYADAKMMSADWKSGAAAAIGVIGAGMGL